MIANMKYLRGLIAGDRQADRVVPPSGFTAQLTLFAAAAMAFLAVFALALSLAAGRLADRWGDELARSATLRIVAPLDQRQAQTDAALRILETTKGVASARALTDADQQALLEPWFGPDLALDTLPVPRLIEVIENDEGMDAAGLRLRLAAEVPGAVLDDHSRWRKPLIDAAADAGLDLNPVDRGGGGGNDHPCRAGRTGRQCTGDRGAAPCRGDRRLHRTGLHPPLYPAGAVRRGGWHGRWADCDGADARCL